MHVLLYNQLNPKKIQNFEKMREFLETGDFRSVGVKKTGDNLYRSRLARSHRLLCSINRHQEQACIPALECIEQHAYDRSRFLRRGASIDENKIPVVGSPARVEAEPLVYLSPKLHSFNVLHKVISFDNAQEMATGCHRRSSLLAPRADEGQDLSNIRMQLILKSLRVPPLSFFGPAVAKASHRKRGLGSNGTKNWEVLSSVVPC